MKETLSKQYKYEYTIERKGQTEWIFNKLIPENAKTCLDIGSGRALTKNFLANKFSKYVSLDIENADIIQDLNKDEIISIKDNSFDIVILSNILEHLVNPNIILKEAIRISKKYLIIGLPNEYPLSRRLDILFGNWDDRIYPYGHKHFFSLKSIDKFIKTNFKGYKKKLCMFKFKKEKYIPSFVKVFLIKCFPTLFIGEVFYLIRRK